MLLNDEMESAVGHLSAFIKSVSPIHDNNDVRVLYPL